jgi:hypothetical protein
MAEHMRMLDSMNARLDTLVSRMNRASGSQKVSAMAAVINELVAQRKAMHENMTELMQSRQQRMHMMPGPHPGAGRRGPPVGPDSAARDTGQASRPSS